MFVPATLEHAADLAPRMRKADQDEVWFSHLMRPLDALEHGVRMSECVAGIDNEGCFIIFGVAAASPLSDTGIPWLLGADRLVTRHRSALQRWAPYVVSDMLKKYRRLENWVDTRNVVSIRWLRRLGYTLDAPMQYGPYGLMFHRFWKER